MRILIVDDEPLVRALAKRALRDHECEMASNSDEALDLAGEKYFDLVITDLRMPGMNGHELVCELLEHPSTPKIIVISACNDPRIKRDLIARGVLAVFPKPIEFATFEQKVTQTLAAPVIAR